MFHLNVSKKKAGSPATIMGRNLATVGRGLQQIIILEGAKKNMLKSRFVPRKSRS
jgi:uncharacterized membrane protein